MNRDSLCCNHNQVGKIRLNISGNFDLNAFLFCLNAQLEHLNRVNFPRLVFETWHILLNMIYFHWLVAMNGFIAKMIKLDWWRHHTVSLVDILENFVCESDSYDDDDHGDLNEISIDTECDEDSEEDF